MRYALLIGYDGTAYSGWQRQPNANTVQQEIERALSIIFKSTIASFGCGRTDAGVHATNFLLHFDLEVEMDPMIIVKLNGILPNDIAAKKVKLMADDFNARFDANFREYRYFLNLKYDPFINNKAYLYLRKLDVAAMNQACELILTNKAFGCFCKAGGNNKTTFCKVSVARWYKRGDKLIFRVKADRFLRNMVRAMVGTLLLVGEGKMTLEEFAEVLTSEDRNRAGKSVPGWALYLWEVGYPTKGEFAMT
jgi:tRNA pseudouridine38-40 synthase